MFFGLLQMEQLYVEVLYTIRHKLGAHSAKYPHHFKEDLVHYAQVAFGVGHEYHRRCNAIASEEKVGLPSTSVVYLGHYRFPVFPTDGRQHLRRRPIATVLGRHVLCHRKP